MASTSIKIKSILKWSFIGLILLFIYFPIIFLTINSFNDSDMIQSGWTGFSWTHYEYFFNPENEPLRVVMQTILLALVVALLSTILGTIGAIGIFYSKKHASGLLSGANRIPVINAEGIYVGTLRNDDIFNYFLDNESLDFRAAERDSVMSIMDPEYSKPLYHSASIDDLIENVKEHNFVPVVDDRGCFIGIVLRRDVLTFLHAFYKDEH